MANDPLSRLASAIGLISHDDEIQRAAAVRGASTLLTRHGLTWLDVGVIVSAHLAGPASSAGQKSQSQPQPAGAPEQPRPEPKPQPRPQPRPEPEPATENPEERAWAEWRRSRGGGEAPRPRRRARQPVDPLRLSGINVPGEIFGRIVLRERNAAGTVMFDVDDENVIYGPLAAFPGVIARSIQRSNGQRIHAKVVPAKERNATPRAYAVDVM